ncbi:hypothetical protein L1049_023495 [Liquidambar formosana]|uniref:Uncharacterized protein n=1 Tax=Liquidambar formosana TaxID=63359 RepID=A0AAP0RUJ1_LIQFO
MQIVFAVFTPSLMFAKLAQTVTLQDYHLMVHSNEWFMPVNIGLTFLFGGILGWIVVTILKPEPYLRGLIIASSSAGNLGNLPLIIVAAMCNEDGTPFGDHDVCNSVGLSYASFSMAIGGIYIWTHSYQLIRISAMRHKALLATEEVSRAPNKDLDANEEASLLRGTQQHVTIVVPSTKSIEEDTENQAIVPQESSSKLEKDKESLWMGLLGILHQIAEELLSPPNLAAILGFIFGATTWLRNLIIGDSAPLRVIQDSVKLLGDGTIPCITLILGGNLIQGLRSSRLKPLVIIGVLCVRYLILPLIGIVVVKTASNLGFLPPDPLFRFVLLIQFTLPPAMNLGTMTQLFDVGREECSVIFLWTYLAAALALTVWSTVYMWILS